METDLKSVFGNLIKPEDNVDWNMVHVDDNGDLVCDVCGKKKTVHNTNPLMIAMFGNLMRVECDCVRKAREMAERLEEAKTKLENRRIETARLRRESRIGERFVNCSFDDFNLENPSVKDAVNTCKAWCDKPTDGVFIYGNSGLGKTMMMACMANRLMDDGNPVFFIDTKQLKDNAYDGEFWKKIANTEYLFFDDLGTETFIRHGEKQIIDDLTYYMVNERYKNLKITVFSSNYSFAELVRNGMRQATVDRIAEMSGTLITVTGKSYRRR